MAKKEPNDSGKNKKTLFRLIFGIRAPKIQRSPIHINDEIEELKDNLKSIKRVCPYDGTQLKLTTAYETIEETSENGEIIHHIKDNEKALICHHCGYTLPIGDIIAEAKQNADKYKLEETNMQRYAIVMLILFVIFAYMFSNLLTLVCGFMFTFVLFLRSFLARYRYWQAVYGRMFEEKPPFVEWLKYEWNKK